MSKFEIVYQINVGSFLKQHYSYEQLEKEIKRLFSFVKADSVILGWFPDQILYEKAVQLIHSFGATAYLWLPVFADIMPSLGLSGENTNVQTASEDELFEFILPQCGTDHVIKEYETVVGNSNFDGVFLDRIRYGFPSDDLSRCSEITEASKTLVNYFHSHNLKVGLDLFAPHLAPYMGQDSPSLGKDADFIKPMMYYRTNAPAGIFFEEKRIQNILGHSVSSKNDGLENLCKNCNVYPGIEVNNIQNIANPTPDYVMEKLNYFRSVKCKGAVLSWNSPDASDEMLSKIADFIRN